MHRGHPARYLEGIGAWAITQVDASSSAYAEIPLTETLDSARDICALREGTLDRRLLRLGTGHENGATYLHIGLPVGEYFKLGIPPGHSDGRIHYFKTGTTGALLSVSQKPRPLSTDSAPHRSVEIIPPPARYPDFGDIVQLFNAPDTQGPFCEIETHWPAVSQAPGETNESEYLLTFSVTHDAVDAGAR